MPPDAKRNGPDAQERTEAANHTHRARNSSAFAGDGRMAVQNDLVDSLLAHLDNVSLPVARREGRSARIATYTLVPA